ncbi:MAG: serine/threonine protein kinase, partial [Deltaproteobacteria bacterium]
MRICPQCGAETPELTCRVDGFGTVDASRHRRVDPRDRIGTLFQNRYRIDAVLGAGGMGSVYRATQVRVGRQVALKVIHADLAHNLAVIARFQREGRAIAALVHPNIVQVYDFGQAEDGELFMAMELIEGRTLCDILRAEAPLDPARVAHLGAQLFDALAEAHERSVIHRDLKPDNIFVTDTGRRHDVVKVVDFGVAKIVNAPEDDAMVTARGAILGSPKYMAPEQARGKGVTGHADVYAIGAILYEALTGHPVFDEPSAADYLVAHSVKLPSPPQVRGRELRGPLVDLIMRCLEKKPWDRPDGAARALEMIEAARLSPLVAPEREDPTTAPGELEPPEATPRGRLHRVVFAGTDATEATPEAPRSSALDHASLAVVPMTHEETTPVSHPAWTPIPTPQAWQDPAGDAPPPPLDTRRLSTAPEPGPLAHAAGEPAHDVAPVETGDGLRGGRIYRDPQREGGLWLVAAVLLLVAGAVLYLTANGLGPADDEHARATGSTPIRSAVEDPSRPLSPMPERGPVAPAQPAVPHADPSPLAGDAHPDLGRRRGDRGGRSDQGADRRRPHLH